MKEWYIECVMLCVYLMIPRMSVKSKAVCRRREVIQKELQTKVLRSCSGWP